MTHRWNIRTAGLVLAALIAMSAFGCGKKAGIHNLVPNQRPAVSLTSAPIDTRDTSFYAYKLNWSGNDPDGRVDHFMYAVDPTVDDTTWTSTSKNEQTIFFRAGTPVLGGPELDPIRGVGFHTFVIKAVDNLGLASAVIERAFFSYTVAPTVQIMSPHPFASSVARVTPSMRITWTGTDPDGQLRQKPVQYKYKLIPYGTPEFDIDYAVTRDGPDSLRRHYARTNFAGWDSVGGDTTSVQFTGLIPEKSYLFVLVGIDEAGAYNANFSVTSNILKFSVGYAGTQGPRIYVYNEFYQYGPANGFQPTNPATWQSLEIPAGQKVTFNWLATPPDGADIDWYRWRLDGNVDDETARTNEETDWYHWSQKSLSVTSCTVGPFFTSDVHTLYIEAQDNNGMLSLVTLKLKPVVATMNTPTGREILVVDDTRLEPTKIPSGSSTRNEYGSVWPSASELDTFLYAVGGVPWMDVRTAVGVAKPNSPAGIMKGYAFDTLGTRQGYFHADLGVPFSTLAQYRHIIWLVDHYGGTNTAGPTNSIAPMGTLHYMCTPGHNNTFSTYTYAGGQVWLMGGAAANASLWSYDATGTDDNNHDYGFSITKVYAGAGYAHRPGKEELQPGRLMYDGAHWQSMMAYQVTVARVIRGARALIPSWIDQPGYRYANPIHRPDFNQLPAQMNTHTNPASDPTNGEAIPLTRPTSYGSQWWSTSNSVDVEYLLYPNSIYEDMNPSAVAETLESSLDTLMDLRGSNLANTGATYEPVTMTWYHGVNAPNFVFSGFPVWAWRRSDVQMLFDFVLQRIWGLSKSTAPSSPSYRASTNPFRAVSSPTKPSAAGATMPVRRGGGM